MFFKCVSMSECVDVCVVKVHTHAVFNLLFYCTVMLHYLQHERENCAWASRHGHVFTWQVNVSLEAHGCNVQCGHFATFSIPTMPPPTGTVLFLAHVFMADGSDTVMLWMLLPRHFSAVNPCCLEVWDSLPSYRQSRYLKIAEDVETGVHSWSCQQCTCSSYVTGMALTVHRAPAVGPMQISVQMGIIGWCFEVLRSWFCLHIAYFCRCF